MANAFREEAIPLVTLENEQFRVNPEALDILRQIPAPLVVVGVAGLYRTGKSYLLNRIVLNRERGFGIGSTINACTKGIWMWGRPIKTQTESGELVNLLILDSEGLGALDQDSAHDCRIFALVLLLSSVFVYNSVGALDESAIDALSLVINLTKHIRVRARKTNTLLHENTIEDDEEDEEELAEYFPAFLWVLRDFALQLVDEDGDAISAQQYLEQALAPRPGISDEVAHKNRVRRLIAGFFRERDCATLVRPLTDEDSLKRLDETPLEKLRPEFVVQALKLREKVLSLNRKKTIRGREVSGEALGGLLASYVNAINGGAVPNIEGAWHYICERQARTLLESCAADFAEAARSRAATQLPLAARALRQILKEIRGQAIARFRKEAMQADNERVGFENELKSRLKELKMQLKADNDLEFENLLSSALNAAYNDAVQSKLVDEKIGNATELNSLLGDLRREFERGEPNGPRKLERLYKFLFSKACDSHTILSKTQSTYTQQLLENKDREQTRKRVELEDQLQTCTSQKQTLAQRVELLHKQLTESEFERAKLEQSLSIAREELAAAEQESTRKRADQNTFLRAKHDDLTRKLDESERTQRTLEASLAKQTAEHETERALLAQKLEFRERQEIELNGQLAKLQARLRRAEDDAAGRLNAQASEFEARLRAQGEELAKLRDHAQQFELQLGQKANAHESMFRDFEDKENELQSFIQTHEKTILSLREQLRTREAQTFEKTALEQQLSSQIAQLEEQLRATEQQIKGKDDKLHLLRIELEKEQALNRQNAEFYEIKLADLVAEAEELKRAKESAFQALQSPSGVKSDTSKQLQEMRSAYEERLRRQSEDFDAEREELRLSLTQQLEDAEKELKSLRREREALLSDLSEHKEALKTANEAVKKLEERVMTLEQTRSEVAKDAEAFFVEKIARLERELEEQIAEKDAELVEARGQLEEGLRTLTETFEGEKARLERRLAEERLRRENTTRGDLEALEKRRVEEIQALEEEIEALQVEVQGQDLKFRATAQKLESEAAAARARQEAAERQLAELRGSLEKDLLGERSRSMMQIQAAEQDRNALLEKNEALKAELGARGLEIFQLRQQLDSATSAVQREKSEHEKSFAELQTEITESRAKIETLVAERVALGEELTITRTQLAKESALHSQKAEYTEKRMTEIAHALDSVQLEHEERLRLMRQEHENTLLRTRSALQEEIAQWEARYEEKKKSAKEIEAALSSKLAELERSRFVLQERLSAAELRRDELERKLQMEGGRSETELRRLKETQTLERKGLFSELEAARREKYELEVALAEATAKFDKDRAVLEGKVSFLEQQARKLRADLAESQSNFDAMFQKFHQFRVADKEESEQAHGAYVLALEQRYSAQIQDLREQNKSLIENYKDKLRGLEKEVRRLEAANQELLAARQNAGQALERKVNELLEAEKRLQDELHRARAELDRAGFSAQKEFEKEREGLKKRLFDAEARVKRAEAERNGQVLEQEKLKTKWHIEKDQLLSQKAETLEILDRLHKQKDLLMRDNEKLRSDLKAAKKASLAGNLLSMSKMGQNRSDLFTVEKSVLSPQEYLGNNSRTGNSSPHE